MESQAMPESATIHWPEGRILEGFPPDKQPSLSKGTNVAAEFNKQTNRWEMVGCFVNGKLHKLIDDPRKAKPSNLPS